ncbi:ATPase, partial [Candidatus Falkowbacteria bacterium]|nr:ATPase [Candidatus Falkowbacteria bacterium]
LNKTLYKPLLEFIDNRNNSINRDLENAGKNASDVVAYYQEIETILSEGKLEAAKIREAAINEANDKGMKRIEQKKNDIEAQNVAFLNALESEKDEFKNGLMAKMPLFKESIHVKLSSI